MHKAIANSTVYHFADDTNLLYSNKDPKEIMKIMNSDLQSLYEWLCANRLSLNVNKTEFIVFRPPKMFLDNRIVLKLNRTKIFESRKIKYLGLIVDDRLSWKYHIDELVKKLNRTIGMLYKIRQFTPSHVLTSLYHSLFSSHLTYGICAWGFANKNLIEKLFKLQKRVIRAITFADYRANSSPILKKLEILAIHDLFEYKLSALMWDFDNGKMPASLASFFTRKNTVHSYQTRSATSGKLLIHKTNTKKYGNNSCKIYGAKLLYELKNDDLYKETITKQAFLNKLKARMLQGY